MKKEEEEKKRTEALQPHIQEEQIQEQVAEEKSAYVQDLFGVFFDARQPRVFRPSPTKHVVPPISWISGKLTADR
jgi:hypothetical protein